jgi:hypothetical protein
LKYEPHERFWNMKTKSKNTAEKTYLDRLREIRDKVSLEIQDMTPDQLKDYLAKKKSLRPNAAWHGSSRNK